MMNVNDGLELFTSNSKAQKYFQRLYVGSKLTHKSKVCLFNLVKEIVF